MALFQGTLYAESLGMNTAVTIAYPGERKLKGLSGELPVLYLFHGLSDNDTSWVRRTDVEFCAEDAGIVLVMPEVQRSFYADMAYGLRYFTYVADELPAFCREMLHISARREDTFAAGLSMGGYGALRVALSRPDRFAAAASFSGAVDAASRVKEHQPEFFAITGSAGIRPEDDLFRLAAQVPGAQRPRIYMSCGLQDFLLEDNRKFSAYLDDLGWEHTFETWEGGHEWPFWNESVRKALRFFLPQSGR